MLHNGEIPISNIDLMHQVARDQDHRHGEDNTRVNSLTMQDALSIATRRYDTISAAHQRRNEKMMDEAATIVNGPVEARRSLMEIDPHVPKFDRMSPSEIRKLRKKKGESGISYMGSRRK